MNPQVPFNELPKISEIVVDETKLLLKLAEDTRVSLELLNYEVKGLPSQDILLDTLPLQEAKVSSEIENIVTTNDSLYKEITFENISAESKEVVNYKDALFIGYTALKRKGLLSTSDLTTINEPVNTKQKGVRQNLLGFEGNYTRLVNDVGGRKEIIYTPPHGVDLLNELLVDMLEYVYNDEIFLVHPLIKIALTHFQFECIHPFHDGNGRTGRILNILLLCQKGYLQYPILYASAYIIRNKNEYYDLFQQCIREADYTPFVYYILRSFKETADKTLSMILEIKAMLNHYKSEAFLSNLDGRKEELERAMDVIFRKVYVRIADLKELGLHRETASNYLQQLVTMGLLREEKRRNEKVFINRELINLFEREEKI